MHPDGNRGDGEAVNGKLAFAVLCIAMVTITFNGIQPVSGMSFADVWLALSGALVIFMLLGSRNIRFPSIPRWHTISVYLLLISGVLGTLASEGSSSGLVNTLRFVVTLFGVPILIGLLASTTRRRAIMVDLWLVSVAINCMVAVSDSKGTHIGQALTGFNFTYIHRPAGLTTQSNHLGYVCVFALPVAIVQMFAASTKTSRVFYIAVIFLIGITVLITKSRVAAAGVIITILLIPFYTNGLSRMVLMTIVAGVILIFGAWFVTSSSTYSVTQLEGRSSTDFEVSDSVHLEDIQQSEESFYSHPFTGTGYNNIHSAQDIYLQLLESGGVLALIAFLTFIGGTLYTSIRVRSTTAIDPRERNIASAVAVGVICWMIMGIIQPPIYDRYLYVGPGILMAIFLSTKRLRVSHSAPYSVDRGISLGSVDRSAATGALIR
jgi:O-Antigen ligase